MMIISIFFATYTTEFGNRVYLYTRERVKTHAHLRVFVELEVRCQTVSGLLFALVFHTS